MVYITTRFRDKIQMNRFPMISLWDLTVVIAIKQKIKMTIILAILKSPYPSNIHT